LKIQGFGVGMDMPTCKIQLGKPLAAAVQTILEIGDGERVMAKHEIGRRFAPTDRRQGFSTPS
jgi:hypothetical protein